MQIRTCQERFEYVMTDNNVDGQAKYLQYSIVKYPLRPAKAPSGGWGITMSDGVWWPLRSFDCNGSVSDECFNISSIFIAWAVTLCFRVNCCSGFAGRIFMFLKYSLKTLMLPYLQNSLAISIWVLYDRCISSLVLWICFCFWHTSFRLKYFLSIGAPYTNRQILS